MEASDWNPLKIFFSAANHKLAGTSQHNTELLIDDIKIGGALYKEKQILTVEHNITGVPY